MQFVFNSFGESCTKSFCKSFEKSLVGGDRTDSLAFRKTDLTFPPEVGSECFYLG